METELREEINAWAPDAAVAPTSDDWFPPIFRDAPFGIAAIDTVGNFVRVNEACARLHGRTIEEMEGAHALTLNGDTATGADYEATLEQGRLGELRHYQNEHMMKRPDGTTAWAIIDGTAVHDTDGHAAYFLLQYHETTAIRELANEAAVGREVVDLTFQYAPIAIYSVDLDGKVLNWNPKAEELFGWSAAEVVDHQIPVAPEEANEEVAAALVDLLKGKTIPPMEAVLRHKDGSQLNVLTSASVVHDSAGDPETILVFTQDLTPQRKAELEVRAGEQVIRTILGRTSESVTVIDDQGSVKLSLGPYMDDLGYSDNYWPGLDVFSLLHPDDLPSAEELFEQVLQSPGEQLTTVLRVRTTDEEYVPFEVAGVNLLDDPDVGGVVLTTRTLTELRRARALLADEARVLEFIATGAPLNDTLSAVTAMVERLSNGGIGSIILLDDDGRMSIATPGQISDEIRELIQGHRPFSIFKVTLEQTSPVVIEDNTDDPLMSPDMGREADSLGIRSGWLAPIIDVTSGEHLGLLSTHYAHPTTITDEDLELAAVSSHLASIAIDRSRAHDVLHHQAHHDALTGLPNRVMILKHLNELVSQPQGTRVAVLFVDLDRFKVVNDSLGHTAGDELLGLFAARLRSAAYEEDLVGRFSADEFVVLLEGIGKPPDASAFLNRLEVALDEPFIVDEGQIFLSASTGIAEARSGEFTADELIEQASAAMVEAKRPGRGRVEVFDHHMRTAALQRLQLERDLRLASDRDEFVLHYQPKIDLGTGGIIGAEALLRWRHPDRGLIYPNDFIPMAEETGMIVRIGRWVLEEAVHQARRWSDDVGDMDDFVIAVNFSARQMSATDLINNLGRVLLKHRWPPDRLSVELTETILIDDAEGSLEVVNQLKSLGVKLTIDDFGTGYSSLSYLHRFPVDVVKIDRAFVTDLQPDGSGSAVSAAVMQMADALGIVTSAEGVETERQLQGLRTLGCDWAQGYLFAKAIPADEMRDLLIAQPAW